MFVRSCTYGWDSLSLCDPIRCSRCPFLRFLSSVQWGRVKLGAMVDRVESKEKSELGLVTVGLNAHMAHAYWWGLTAWRFPTLSCFCMLSWNRNGWLALTEAMFMKPGISRLQWRTHANEAMMSWYHLTAVSSPHKSLPLRRGSYSSTTRWWKFRQGPNVIIWVVHSCAMLQNDMLQDFHSIVCMVCMANDSGSRSLEFLASMARIKQQMSCPQSGTSCWLNFNRTGLLRCS